MWNKDLTSAAVLFICCYNLLSSPFYWKKKRYIFFSEFFNCNVLKIGVFVYSQTCIEQSPSGDGIPQNRGNIKNDKKYHLCRNWSLFYKNSLKILLTSISAAKHGLNFTKKKSLLVLIEWFHFVWLFLTCEIQWWSKPLNRCSQSKMKITVIKGKKIWYFGNWPLNTGWPLNMVLLNIGSTVSWIQQEWQLFMTYWNADLHCTVT